MTRLGIFLSEPCNPNLPVLFKNAGLDHFMIDCEHGWFDYPTAAQLVMTARLCGLEAIVRIPNNGRKDVLKFTEMGADGLLLPMTSSPAEIAEVVRNAFYPPLGRRGVSTMLAHSLYAPPALDEYMPLANARVKVYAEIETVAGVRCIDEILAVPGVAGAIVGPNDLGQDFDALGKNGADEVPGAIAAVGEACKRAGAVAGIITGKKPLIDLAKRSGYTLICRGSELHALVEYCKETVADFGD